MKKNVMKKAWEIAKGAAKRHGGKAREYISESLKLAWVLINKKSFRVEIVLNHKNRNSANIFKLDGVKEDGSFVKSDVSYVLECQTRRAAYLEDGGVYEIHDARGVKYVEVDGEDMNELSVIEAANNVSVNQVNKVQEIMPRIEKYMKWVFDNQPEIRSEYSSVQDMVKEAKESAVHYGIGNILNQLEINGF